MKMPAAPLQALPAPKQKGQEKILILRDGAKKSSKIPVQVPSPKKSQEETLSYRRGWMCSSLQTVKVVKIIAKTVTIREG